MSHLEASKKRHNFYQKYAPFWFDLEQTPYALYDCLSMEEFDIHTMREVAEKIIQIYHKTAKLLQHMKSDTYADLGFPTATFPFLADQVIDVPSIIQRLDMVYDGMEWKHYEINSDTPTFIMECYEINDEVANHFGYEGVNAGKKEELVRIVSDAMVQSLAVCGFSKQTAKVVFTAHKESVEDWETTVYLASLFRDFQIEVLPLEDLCIVSGDALYTKNGERIHLLYRQTYPLEFLVLDKDEQTEEAIGVELLQLVTKRKLALCNPISAFLLQSKAVQALIWGLHEINHECFTELEHTWIEKHFLPTYLDSDLFVKNHIPFVEKPVFGREGNTIQIQDGSQNVRFQVQANCYESQLKVYQKYVPLQKKRVQAPYGEIDAHILIGCFVIGKSVGAIGARAGHLITGNESYFLPIGMKK